MSRSGQAALPPFIGLVAHEVRWRLLSELARSDLRVRELVALVGQPQNLVSYHLRLLRSGGLVTARRSSHDGRDSYYHLDLERLGNGLAATGAALHPALGPVPAPARPRETVSSVLFACTGNSARSPIAEALLHRRTGGRVEVTSAGSHPKPRLHPAAVRVLRERYGIDVAGRRPRPLDDLTGRDFTYVITLCDKVREVCPEFGDHSRRIHWSIPDPAASDDAGQAAFVRTAAEIDTRIGHLLPQLAQPEQEIRP
ncbi:ArsR family transcriptional regulator [Actinomadura sp. 6K520]|uniref:arsenate reductase/protein-tyrosine-phosphatase family protein n=1 Tax=Actinomadura sp. 6K520 TaxID=2530364 RepID=UPI001045466A|nr:ArsR family transcriptional regulator [Actinomadura sp. 6K520]TDE36534.1 ArsR family transcriptional regulator [Actinomadura sp. 6K520]